MGTETAASASAGHLAHGTMSLIMTIDDDSDDNNAPGGEDDSDDDDDFVMGGGGPSTDGIVDPSTSGKWQTASARTNLKTKNSNQIGSSLNEKLAARASKAAQDSAPALRADEAAGDGLRERKQSAVKERKKAAAVAAKAAAKAEEEEEGASDPLTAVTMTTFDALKLCKPLLKAVWELGFVSPTPIQTAVMPAALRGVDICASAVTGSGKTAAFLLPALERLVHRQRRIAATRVLVLTPTRELAAQCEEMGRQLAKFTDVRFALIVGGLSLKSQEADLRSRPDVVVATPGRLIDLLRNSPSVSIDELEILILDEADRCVSCPRPANTCPPIPAILPALCMYLLTERCRWVELARSQHARRRLRAGGGRDCAAVPVGQADDALLGDDLVVGGQARQALPRQAHTGQGRPDLQRRRQPPAGVCAAKAGA